MDQLAKDISPRVLLFGQTSIGRDLAPRLAFRLGAGLCMDCLEIQINTETRKIEFTRSVYGGNARAVFVTDKFPQMATLRRKALPPSEPDNSRVGEVIPIEMVLDPKKIRTKILEIVKEDVGGVKLEDAEIIITGGRGVGGPEGFEQLRALASLLKGAVGATRPPCDSKWVPCPKREIGLPMLLVM